MTKDVKKMKYKEAQALYEDSSQPSELRAQAKERMDSIRKWLDSKQKEKPQQSSTVSINPDCFKDLPDEQRRAIEVDAKNLTQAHLCRIYYINEELKKCGLNVSAPFLGMLFNNQILTK